MVNVTEHMHLKVKNQSSLIYYLLGTYFNSIAFGANLGNSENII